MNRFIEITAITKADTVQLMRYFFDLPVYRLPEEKYYRERNKFIDNLNPTMNDAWRDCIERSYGGVWRFNEIIGYIRLHFLGSQVRGEYFAVSKKRVVRTRKKTLEYQTHKLCPEVDIPLPYSQENILRSIRQYIDDCKKEVSRRYVDTEMFEAIADFVDWPGILGRQ